MKVVKDADRVGKKVTVSEKMEVLYSATFSGAPLDGKLLVEFLKGEGPEVLVQTTLQVPQIDKRETKTWDLASLVTNDFKNGKLNGFKEYAEDLFPESDTPAILFRRALVHESEHLDFQVKPARAPRVQAQVVHSRVKSV